MKLKAVIQDISNEYVMSVENVRRVLENFLKQLKISRNSKLENCKERRIETNDERE